MKRHKAEFLTLQFSGINGSLKSRLFPADATKALVEEGFGFDGSSIAGFVDINQCDLVAKPDPTTFSILPWTSGTKKSARMLCDVYFPDGKPFDGDPRFILKRVAKESTDMGFVPFFGAEVEFSLFNKEKSPIDYAAYMDYIPLDMAENFKMELFYFLRQLSLRPEVAHHETGPGQNELNFGHAEALRSADNVAVFKQAVKILASQHNLIASFMAKPLFGYGAHGAHRHVSLCSSSGKNLFYDKNSPNFLSKLARFFVGGLLAHAKALSAIVSPTVNSYKRFVPGLEAPIYLAWGWNNRSLLVKIPTYFPKNPAASRIEYRGVDSSSNPYLDHAVILKAGLDGIKKKMDPGVAVSENLYHMSKERIKELELATLPSSLGDAINELKKDEVVKEALGEYCYQRFAKLKESEWKEYLAEIERTGDPGIQISEWELNRYLLHS
ncbi:MAG TPA: glutamine synthetase family protein [Candidatus Bathyarchaeia archaeon]|nr:glutamine synthetase family protein [Candidatus Bathyarchaeia archaeon]